MRTRTITNQASYHNLVGDTVNVSVLVASVVYVSTVVYFTLPGVQGVVDEHWKKDGFCIQNIDVPYWSSFDYCLYVDVLFSVVLGAMYFAWRDIPGMESSSASVPALIAATLGHGIAHGAMAVKFRDGSYHQHEDDAEVARPFVPALWQMLVFCAIFWFPLLKAAMPKIENQYVAVLSAFVTYGQGFVKKELGFAYVQTIVNIAFHISQLMLSSDEKNRREYMMMPMANVLPIVVAWNEVLFCDSYFRSAGGHVLYDASIIVSFIVFYLDCYSFSTKSTSKSLTKEKTT